MISICPPAKAILTDLDPLQLSKLKKDLTYTDGKVKEEHRRLKNNRWLRESLGNEEFAAQLRALKAEMIKCAVYEDPDGTVWTYSGLAKRASASTGHPIEHGSFATKQPRILPWHKVPYDLRPYQEAAKEALLKVGHGAVSIGTGLGKSLIILYLVKELGLKAVVMTPSASICNQIYQDFLAHLGPKLVGKFGDGKKDLGKLVTVAIHASLANVEPGTKAWDHFSDADVFIADESHLTPAKTLQHVCMGLLKTAPYRFFFSGTQVRNDGLDLVLEGIIGPIVYTMTVKEGVDQGYLAKPIFTMVQVDHPDWTPSSEDGFDATPNRKGVLNSKDAQKMTRTYLYYNKDVNAIAGDLANQFVESGRPTLILVKELRQFVALLPHLKHKVAFAHGPLKEEEGVEALPKDYMESDVDALVKDFNDGKLPILVGTGCIVTGTDIRPAEAVIFLRGQTSPIDVPQAVGRSTRMVAGKVDCHFVDFRVGNVPTMNRHALAREAIYNSIYGPVIKLDLRSKNG